MTLPEERPIMTLPEERPIMTLPGEHVPAGPAPTVVGGRMSRRGALRAALLGTAAVAGAATLLQMRAPATALADQGPAPRLGPIDGGDADAGTVVIQWDTAALRAIRDTHPGPPIVARALAIVHTCMYDAWAAYDPVATGTRLGGALRRPAAERTAANKAEAVSYAAYHALGDLFPSKTPLFAGLLEGLGYDPHDQSTDTGTPRGIGNVAAQAVLAFRHRDGANQLGDLHPGAYSDDTGYQPVNTPERIIDPNRWQPLRVSDGRTHGAVTGVGWRYDHWQQGQVSAGHTGSVVQQYIAPHWGHVTPFALSGGAQFRPAVGPATAGSAHYREQAEQILRYSAILTDEQKVIAEYWADGPASELPPGHWCLFARFVSARDHHDLDADVTLFFALTNAIFDASVAAWDAKRAYDSVRPVTAIAYLFGSRAVRAWAGPYRGTRPMRGLDWRPYQAVTVVTPPFPEYVSGHSIFSAAGAEVLKRFTGSDACGATYTQQAGVSRVEPGMTPATDVTLTWATFSEAADQAGLSRRYGGIHFVDGDLIGRAMGRQVGALAWAKARAYITGTAAS